MSRSLNHLDVRDGLIETGRDFHARGWMAGTAGNLSVRQTDNCFWITASGKAKGRLDQNDFVRVEIESGHILENPADSNRPSAETSIHQAIYQQFDDAMACLHVHTIDACLATERFARSGRLLLPALEMVKGFDIWQQDPEVYLPIFENQLDVTAIAQTIAKQFSQSPPQLTALMIECHGVTVWGRSLQEAYNRVEIIEFIMSYLARQG